LAHQGPGRLHHPLERDQNLSQLQISQGPLQGSRPSALATGRRPAAFAPLCRGARPVSQD
jgi:hypothetical protein